MQLLSLRECRDWILLHEPTLPCPSLITLKRWSAQGKLNGAKVGRGRQVFSCPKLIKILRGLHAPITQDLESAPDPALTEGPAEKPAPSSMGNEETDWRGEANAAEQEDTTADKTWTEVMRLLESLSERVSSIEANMKTLQDSYASVGALIKAASDLDSTRKMLMLRHDEALTQLKARIQASEDTSRAIKDLGALPLELGRLQGMITSLQSKLETAPGAAPSTQGDLDAVNRASTSTPPGSAAPLGNLRPEGNKPHRNPLLTPEDFEQ